MFHLRIWALFIPFASLSLAFNIANPLQYRQDNNTSTSTPSPSSSHSTPNNPSSIPSSQPTSTHTTDSTTTTSSDAETTSLQGSATTSPTVPTIQDQPRLSADTESSTLRDGSSRTTSSITTQKIVTTIISTSGSVTLSITSTSSKVVTAGGASATSSGIPGLSGNTVESGSSGLSPKTKSVIGGVVGGVGGAILLGGLAIIFWRVWGKSRRSHNDLMGPQSGPEKNSSVSGHSPFVSLVCSIVRVKMADR